MKRVQWIEAPERDKCFECGSAISAGATVLEDDPTGRVWCEDCGRMVEGENWADQEVE